MNCLVFDWLTESVHITNNKNVQLQSVSLFFKFVHLFPFCICCIIYTFLSFLDQLFLSFTQFGGSSQCLLILWHNCFKLKKCVSLNRHGIGSTECCCPYEESCQSGMQSHLSYRRCWYGKLYLCRQSWYSCRDITLQWWCKGVFKFQFQSPHC